MNFELNRVESIAACRGVCVWYVDYGGFWTCYFMWYRQWHYVSTFSVHNYVENLLKTRLGTI